MIELKTLQRRTGISFIWVTHDQNEAFSLGDLVVVMNHARIEQQGTPEEILQRPRTPFVAGFVQGNNVFRGKVEEVRGSEARIGTAAGSFVVPVLDLKPQVGQDASFSVRAERLRPSPPQGWPNSLATSCRTVEYFGSVRRYILERPDGEVLKLDQFGAEPAFMATDATAVIGWPTEAGVLHG
jgi:ABC-type Fe3+/spermidine/putrescine transport system ATPase subunit